MRVLRLPHLLQACQLPEHHSRASPPPHSSGCEHTALFSTQAYECRSLALQQHTTHVDMCRHTGKLAARVSGWA